jgi:hypothetical protein
MMKADVARRKMPGILRFSFRFRMYNSTSAVQPRLSFLSSAEAYVLFSCPRSSRTHIPVVIRQAYTIGA